MRALITCALWWLAGYALAARGYDLVAVALALPWLLLILRAHRREVARQREICRVARLSERLAGANTPDYPHRTKMRGPPAGCNHGP